jgi:hypothetical protein
VFCSDADVFLVESTSTPELFPSLYCRLVGRLTYATNTQIDLAFAAGHLCQYMARPAAAHGRWVTSSIVYQTKAPCPTPFYTKEDIQYKYKDSPVQLRAPAPIHINLQVIMLSQWQEKLYC